MTFDQIFFHSSPSVLSILGTLIIVCSAIFVAVRISVLRAIYALSLIGLSDCVQVTKENTGKHKRMQSQLPSVEDITLEEGLLANQEDHLYEELESKEAMAPSHDDVHS